MNVEKGSHGFLEVASRFLPRAIRDRFSPSQEVISTTSQAVLEEPREQIVDTSVSTSVVNPSPDLSVPKAVLWALRRGRNLDSLLVEEEGRMKVFSTLAAAVLLDRNFRTIVVFGEGEEQKRITEKHINRRWRQTQFAALNQIAKLDGEEAASVLYGIVEKTRIAEFAPQSGPAEELEERVRNLERELIGSNFDEFFNTFSSRWLPWHRSWRGGQVHSPASWDLYDFPDHLEISFKDRPEIMVRTVGDERGKLQERACRLLGYMEHPSSIRALLQIGGFEWGKFPATVVDGLVRKGLKEKEATRLLAELKPLSVDDTYRVAREIAEKGLGSRAAVLG